jgi:hypothetical protein
VPPEDVSKVTKATEFLPAPPPSGPSFWPKLPDCCCLAPQTPPPDDDPHHYFLHPLSYAPPASPTLIDSFLSLSILMLAYSAFVHRFFLSVQNFLSEIQTFAKYLCVTRHTSHVTRHTSHVTRHTSHVTRHTSHVTRHTWLAELILAPRCCASTRQRRFQCTWVPCSS